jgi:hypothetical protein
MAKRRKKEQANHIYQNEMQETDLFEEVGATLMPDSKHNQKKTAQNPKFNVVKHQANRKQLKDQRQQTSRS